MATESRLRHRARSPAWRACTRARAMAFKTFRSRNVPLLHVRLRSASAAQARIAARCRSYDCLSWERLSGREVLMSVRTGTFRMLFQHGGGGSPSESEDLPGMSPYCRPRRASGDDAQPATKDSRISSICGLRMGLRLPRQCLSRGQLELRGQMIVASRAAPSAIQPIFRILLILSS